MTREEAINILNALKFILNNDQYTDEIEEALDMAISALQQPNQFADGDKKDDHLREVTKKVSVISRQAANQTVLEFIIEYLGGAFDEVFQKKLMERMNALPSVQPELIRINLNEPIKVKLTDWGKEIYYHQYDRTNQIAGREICEPKFPKEDENGYTEFQLWCFMELYGEHMGMTLPNVIKPLEIVYER